MGNESILRNHHSLNKKAFEHIETWPCSSALQGLSLCLCRWCLPETQLGRRYPECFCSCCHWRQSGWLPEYPWRCGIHERRSRKLAFFLCMAERARAYRYTFNHRQQKSWYAGNPEVFPDARYQCCTVIFTEIYFLSHFATR